MLKDVGLILTEFRTVAVGLIALAAVFPDTWTWAADAKQDAPAVRETLEQLRKEAQERERRDKMQMEHLQMQLNLMRDSMLLLHGPGNDDRGTQ